MPDKPVLHQTTYSKKGQKDDFIKYFKEAVHQFYGEDVLSSSDYPKIINEQHYLRLINLMKDQKSYGGGYHDKNKIEPTL